jgi:GNAT superfamily N-acetyltransferase
MKKDLFKIRAAVLSDVPVVVQMIKELAGFEKIEASVTEENLQEVLFHDPKGPEALIAEEDHIPIGYLIFFQSFSCSLGKRGIYIEDVYIKEPYRKKGYGTLFFKEIAKITKARKCNRLDWSVFNWNEKAIKFYQKIGGIPMNEWTFYCLTEKALDNFLENKELFRD